VVDGLLPGDMHGGDQFRQGDHGTAGALHGNLAQFYLTGALVAGQDGVDPQGLALPGQVQRGRGVAGQGDAQGLDDLLGGDPVQGGFLLVHHEIDPIPVGFGRVVDVRDKGLGGHDGFNVGGAGDQLPVGNILVAVYFGNQGRHHRRAGGRFHQLDVGPVFMGDPLEVFSQPQDDGVALLRTPFLATRFTRRSARWDPFLR
jgi:hypothetical protein